MTVSKRLRYEILRRDNHTCRYCGRSAPEVRLTVDHVLATTLGGTDVPANLVAACADCNSGKSASTPDAVLVADVSEDVVRWARARHMAAAEMLTDLQRRDEVHEEFREQWNDWGYGNGQFKKGIPLPAEWEVSVDTILAAGLPMEVLLECLNRAMQMSNRRNGPTDDNIFRYMCGIAWNKVTELQDKAQAFLDDDAPRSPDDADVLDEELTRWALIAETFLTSLPMWVHEEAERRTDHDFHCAGEPDAGRKERLPHIIRHVGNVLRNCQISRPEPAEVD